MRDPERVKKMTTGQWLCGGETWGERVFSIASQGGSTQERRGRLGKECRGKAMVALLRGPEKLLEGHGQSREKRDPVPPAQSQESGPLGISVRSEHPRPGSVSLGKECPGTPLGRGTRELPSLCNY